MVDGDTTSPATLAASPGPDGVVSLREALLAAEGADGPLEIDVAASLSGGSIALDSDLPPIVRDGLSLVGPEDAAGRPLVTISGSAISVFASRFRAAGLRFTAARGAALFVYAGAPDPGAAPAVENVRIEDCVFDGAGAFGLGHGVAIGTADGSSGASVRNVAVSRCTFDGYVGDVAAVLVDAGGAGGTVESVSVTRCHFTLNATAVRVGMEGTDDRLSGILVADGVFVANDLSIAAICGAPPGRPPSGNGVLDGFAIARNLIREGSNAAIYLLAGGTGATGFVVRDVEIVDDVIWGGETFGIGGEGGSGAGATGNRIESVRIVNDTIALSGDRSGLAFYANTYGAVGNGVSGIEVVNSIFSGGGEEFAGDAIPDLVSHSIVRDGRFAGTSGNFSAIPGFVDAARGNFHLLADSPAIGKGDPREAPCTDLDGNARLTDGKVDLGALEFGAVPEPRPCPIAAVAAATPPPLARR